MGFVDRGGGRESKGSSLRRSSKNPGTAVAKGKSAPKNTSAATAPATRVGPALPAVWQPFRDVDVRCVTGTEGGKDNNNEEEATTKVTSELVNALRTLRTNESTLEGHIRRVQVDAAVSLLSRSLQDDVQGLMRRACEEGRLRALLCWSRELERQASLLDYCRSHNKLYAQSLTTESTTTSGNATHEKKKTVRFAVANSEEEDNDAKKSDNNNIAKDADDSAEEGCLLYCLVGIHVGNIVRTHRKIQEQWIEDIAVLARQPEVVGIVSGINFARDPATHYAQEWLLKECWRIAAELHLPLVIFVEANVTENAGEVEGSDESGADRVAEVLRELMTHTAAAQADHNNDDNIDAEKKEVLSPTAVVLHNGLRVLSHSPVLRDLVRRQRVTATPPFYVLTSAEDIEYVMQRESEQKTVKLLPGLYEESVTTSETCIVSLTQLLLGTNSPWGTPQNIDDAYLRTQRNEPANYPWVLRTLYEAMQQGTDTETPFQVATSESTAVLTSEDVADVVLCNFLRVFFAHSEVSNMKEEGRSETVSSQLPGRPSALKFIAPNPSVAEDASSEDNTRLAKPFVITHADPIDNVEHAVQSHLHAKVEDAEWHALLAQAAREREAIEAERAAREHDAALAPKPEKHRQKKVNVKANNRSNFTHFRNKDFTPRLTRAEKAAALVNNTQPHSPSESESDNDGVEMESEAVITNTMKPKAKPKKQRETRTTSHQPQGSASSTSSSSSCSDDDSDDEGKETGMQPSRSQRKKMQRRRKNKGQPQTE